MSLATILLPFIVYFATPSLPAHLLPLVPQSSQTGDAGQSRDAGTNAQTQTPPASQAPTPSPAENQKSTNSKRRKQTKKAAASTQVECPPANSGSGAAPTNAASAGTSPNGTAPSAAQSNQATSNQSPSNQTPSNQAPSNQASPNKAPSNAGTPKAAAPSGNASPRPNCPPSKTVVHDGGTTESSIQLVGGKGNEQAAQQRSTTDQLLGSTEDNLKKIAGRQLNSTQQEMVNQIQQFMEQSRAAVSAGDLARGQNLAMKAHLLSDELVKP